MRVGLGMGQLITERPGDAGVVWRAAAVTPGVFSGGMWAVGSGSQAECLLYVSSFVVLVLPAARCLGLVGCTVLQAVCIVVPAHGTPSA